VGHDDRRLAPFANDAGQVVAELAPKRAIEGRERFVQKKQVRVDGQGAPQCDALLLTTRKLARAPSFQAAEAEPLHDVPGALRHRAGTLAPQPERDVVLDREMRKQRVALEDVSEAPGA
jgi:hypothetical protein